MTARIAFSGLWTHGEEHGDRLAVDALERDGELGHIHGTLVIEVAGRSVPYLGFFGPDDVCIDTWLVELCSAVNELSKGDGEYVFDEGEQGQPAFKFARDGERLLVSIVQSVITGVGPDPDFQNVECRFPEFVSAVDSFIGSLREELRRTAPLLWERWWPAAATLTDAS